MELQVAILIEYSLKQKLSQNGISGCTNMTEISLIPLHWEINTMEYAK